jgi:hypothetical protein
MNKLSWTRANKQKSQPLLPYERTYVAQKLGEVLDFINDHGLPLIRQSETLAREDRGVCRQARHLLHRIKAEDLRLRKQLPYQRGLARIARPPQERCSCGQRVGSDDSSDHRDFIDHDEVTADG